MLFIIFLTNFFVLICGDVMALGVMVVATMGV
jgi:hypothetical protein